MLDVHSTSSPSPPFAITSGSQSSKDLASSLPVKFVLEGMTEVVSGTSIEYARKCRKTAACVECGQHDERRTVDIAKEAIKTFLLGSRKRMAEHILKVDTSEKLRRGFRFAIDVRAFQKVKYDDLIAVDDEVGEMHCPYENGSWIIMPSAYPVVGEEAWFWGVPTGDMQANHSKKNVKWTAH